MSLIRDGERKRSGMRVAGWWRMNGRGWSEGFGWPRMWGRLWWSGRRMKGREGARLAGSGEALGYSGFF